MTTNGAIVDPFEEPKRVSSQERLLQMLQQKWPNYHPVVAMVQLSMESDDEKIQLDCHREVAKYVVQVDKFVEVKQEVRKTKRVVVQLFGGGQQTQLPDATDVTDLTPRLESPAQPVLVPAMSAEANDETVVRTRTVSTGPIEEPEERQGIGASALAGVWGDPEVGRSLEGRFG